MLNCRDVTHRSSDYLEGSLPRRVRMEFRLYLLMCRFCRQYFRQLQLVVGALRRLPADDGRVDVSPELLRQFHAEHFQKTERR